MVLGPVYRPVLCLDFDGVCHSYTSGWQGVTNIPDLPVDGLYSFLREALKHFEVHIFSSRSHQSGGIAAMSEWFYDNAPDEYSHIPALLKFPLEKPPATVFIDDRAITFTGVWPTMDELKNFKPWNR